MTDTPNENATPGQVGGEDQNNISYGFLNVHLLATPGQLF